MQPPFDIAADLDTPVSAYLKLEPLKPRFLLESVEGGMRLARYSFLGFGDAFEIRMYADELRVGGELRDRPQTQADYLGVLREALARAPDTPTSPPVNGRSSSGFGSGARASASRSTPR